MAGILITRSSEFQTVRKLDAIHGLVAAVYGYLGCAVRCDMQFVHYCFRCDVS